MGHGRVVVLPIVSGVKPSLSTRLATSWNTTLRMTTATASTRGEANNKKRRDERWERAKQRRENKSKGREGDVQSLHLK